MTAIDSLLACPRCDTPLGRPDKTLWCDACKLEFPEHGGIVWLFSEPHAAMADWHNRWQLAVSQSQHEAQRLDAARKSSERQATQKRLGRLRDAHLAHADELRSLLEPLALTTSANLQSFLALRTRLPPGQGLTSYAANLFRDWCWGAEENTASLNAVRAALGAARPQKILILGAGAGRLAYDLHQHLQPQITVALDNNPLFMSLLNDLAAGHSRQLTEFPLAPDSASHTAINRTLSAPVPADPGLIALLADGLRAPLQSASFDLVVTPWFLDVIDATPADVAARINRLLAASGTWINHGSLAFSGPDPATHLSLNEFMELMTEHGFADAVSAEQEVPYMDCPQSRHSRRERVVTTRATKIAETRQPKRHQALPEWIVTGREPVPLRPEFQTQAMSTRIHAFIMSLIDGKRSLNDMAALMEEQRLMTKREGEQAIRGFLIKMFDDAQRGRGY
jgi:hypothetical protein